MEEKKVMKKSKAYWGIFITNLIFFGLFWVAFSWEQSLSGLQYNAFGMLFYPLLLLYILFYAPISYKKTNHIILPNFIFFIFLDLFLVWLYMYSKYAPDNITQILNNFLGSLVTSGIFTLFSVMESLITKLICIALKKRAHKKNIHTYN